MGCERAGACELSVRPREPVIAETSRCPRPDAQCSAGRMTHGVCVMAVIAKASHRDALAISGLRMPVAWDGDDGSASLAFMS